MSNDHTIIPESEVFLIEYVRERIRDSVSKLENLSRGSSPVMFEIAYNSLCGWYNMLLELEPGMPEFDNAIPSPQSLVKAGNQF